MATLAAPVFLSVRSDENGMRDLKNVMLAFDK